LTTHRWERLGANNITAKTPKSTEKTLPMTMESMGMCVHAENRQLIVFGGFNDNGFSNEILTYDLERK
jgi:hypothetical protein